VALTTEYEEAATPPKVTEVAPVKLVPVMVTTPPAPTETGVNELIEGGGKKVNPAKVPVPEEFVTLTEPEDPLETVAVILVLLLTVNEAAAAPPKLTAVAPVKLVPVIDMVDPWPPDVGVKEVMVGGVAAPGVDTPAQRPVTAPLVLVKVPV